MFTNNWANASCDASEMKWNQWHERMNEVMAEGLQEGRGWMTQPRDEGANEWVHAWMKEWMREWMNAWINAWMNAWMRDGKKAGINASMNHWMKEWRNDWMNQWVKRISERFNGNESVKLSGLPLLWATTFSQLLLCRATTFVASAPNASCRAAITTSPLAIPGVQWWKKILFWWVTTFSKLTSKGLDFHLWGNLKLLTHPPFT